MAKRSNIEWTDSTVNFWWGCTKVGPGCDHCYAETWSKRTGENIWGTGVPRRKIKSAVALLHRLDNGYSWCAADHAIAGHHQTSRRRVFIQSMSDLFDLEVPVEWFAEAWQTIERCSRLHVQIVTKRISAVEKRLAAIGATIWPQHAGLIITVCNQTEVDRDIPRLLALKAKLDIPWVGLSMEPLLGPVDLTKIDTWAFKDAERLDAMTGQLRGIFGERVGCVPALDWVIVGGESGVPARPMHPDWLRSLRDQCIAAEVPFFFKQWGNWVSTYDHDRDDPDWRAVPKVGDWSRKRFLNLAGGIGFHGDKLNLMKNVGKKAAGRLLDGIEYNAMPRAFQ